MKSNPCLRWVAACLPLFSFISAALGQPIAGTNAPGASSTFSVALDASVTNLSLTVTGNVSSYSHLLVRHGSPPTDTSYDFISALNGQTNAIHLEQPQMTNGTYFVRVRTPATSVQHAFTLLIETNSVDMRSTNRPAMQNLPGAVTGVIALARSHFFRFELTNAANLRIALNGSGLGADLYVQRGQLPTTANFWKRSINATNDLLPLLDTEAIPGSYFIAVTTPAGATSAAPYTLRVDEFTPTPLAWDPGLTHDGTLAHSNTNGVAGDYYFRITTANPSLGAWRTALRVLQGEAQLYLSRSVLPSPGAADFKSERIGSDGFILSSAQFAPNEVWYILVRASVDTQWQLVSGAPYVRDLGTVTDDGLSGSGAVEIGPEGMRFFSATVPANMLAWRLWLNGATNSILLKKTSLPLPTANELTQPRQALVVPPYLTGGQQYSDRHSWQSGRDDQSRFPSSTGD